jgi:NAD(P)-dependent dehydrogenase (short-subunit alcohol dehydrogenase family)
MARTYAVTGVASGIGAQLARVLTEAGHRVVGFDLRPVSRNVDRFVTLDLNDPDAIAAAAATIDEPLDGLCNNAGLPPREGLETAILQVNFLGQRAFADAMLPHLIAGASMVNMASRAGHGWQANLDQIKRLAALSHPDQLPGFVAEENIDAVRAYNLSKEAMILWTLAIAEDMVARDMRANTLSPGGVATGILDDFKRAFGAKMASNVARAGRTGDPAERARTSPSTAAWGRST